MFGTIIVIWKLHLTSRFCLEMKYFCFDVVPIDLWWVKKSKNNKYRVSNNRSWVFYEHFWPMFCKHHETLDCYFANVISSSAQPLKLGKKFDSKLLPSIFASSKAFRWQKFSCLFLLAARVHKWIILHSYVEKHIWKKDILLAYLHLISSFLG